MRYQTNCATIRKQTGAVQWEIDKLLKMLREDGAIGNNNYVLTVLGLSSAQKRTSNFSYFYLITVTYFSSKI
jgi:hypothetical protein